MAYQEVKTTGYGTRVGNSFKSIGTGLLLFCAATAVLWWNEGRAVKTDKMLDEAESAYVEMENPDKKDASLEGELVCGTALATTDDSLTDKQFGVAVLPPCAGHFTSGAGRMLRVAVCLQEQGQAEGYGCQG